MCLATAVNGVTPNYFKTMSIPLLAGRLWSESFLDPRQKPRVVVNQAFAQRYFPGADPIGKRFSPATFGQVANADTEIIGEVSDAKYRSLREPIQPTIFNLFTYTEVPFVVVVKTRGKPALWIQPIRQAIASFDSSMPIVEVETLAEEVGASASGERLTAALAAIFAVAAVLMSGAGIYGLLAYVVAQRRREIGIRLALGATSGAVRELIGRQALAMVMGGMILGLGAARAAAPLIASMLYGVTGEDARSLVAAAVIVLAIAALATAIPASRAARINPAAALRDDY
jgi:hypothetical protein